jgi:hypothetical protein
VSVRVVLCLEPCDDLFQSRQQGIDDDLGVSLWIVDATDEAQHHTQVVGKLSAAGKILFSVELLQFYQEQGARLTFSTQLVADIGVAECLQIEG